MIGPVVHVSDCEAIGGGLVPTILKSRCPSLMDIACNGRRGWKIPLTGKHLQLNIQRDDSLEEKWAHSVAWISLRPSKPETRVRILVRPLNN